MNPVGAAPGSASHSPAETQARSRSAAAAGFGRLGIWSGAPRFAPDGGGLRVTRLLEDLGYSAVWVPGGVDDGVLASFDPLLEGTSAIKLCTGILNIWKHEPADVAAWFDAHSPAQKARLMLGLGASHGPLIGDAYQKPFAKMAAFLDGLEAAGMAMDHLCLGAHGPKMLAMAAARTAGSHPYLVTVEHSARFRAALGPDALLAPEMGVVLESDPATARGIARAMVQFYTTLPNYTNNWKECGFTQEDIDTLSDRLIDALVAWGDLDAIARRLDEHYTAGADHVCVQVMTQGGMTAPVEESLPVWRDLARLL